MRKSLRNRYSQPLDRVQCWLSVFSESVLAAALIVLDLRALRGGGARREPRDGLLDGSRKALTVVLPWMSVPLVRSLVCKINKHQQTAIQFQDC